MTPSDPITRDSTATPNIAKEDRTVTEALENGGEVQRKVFAGQAIPPNLVDAYEAAGKPSKAKS